MNQLTNPWIVIHEQVARYQGAFPTPDKVKSNGLPTLNKEQ